MSGIIYLDANSLTYAAKAGGADLLNALANYWEGRGYTLATSDAVRLDLDGNTSATGATVREWMDDRGISTKPTSYGGANYVSGQSYGEKAIVELAIKDVAGGQDVIVWSDDKFFTKEQNLKALPKGFMLDNVTGSAEMLNKIVADGGMTFDDYKTTVESYRTIDQFKNSARLDKFAPAEVIQDISSSIEALPESQQASAVKQILLQKGVPLLGAVSSLAVFFDAMMSSAEAAHLAEEGQFGEAGLTMARFAARLYVGAELGAAGLLVGGPVGGIIGGIAGTIGGDLAAQEIYYGSRQVLYKLGLIDDPNPPTRLVVTPHPFWSQLQSDLVAAGVSAPDANEYVGKVLDAFAVAQRSDLGLTPEQFWASLQSQVSDLKQYQGTLSADHENHAIEVSTPVSGGETLKRTIQFDDNNDVVLQRDERLNADGTTTFLYQQNSEYWEGELQRVETIHRDLSKALQIYDVEDSHAYEEVEVKKDASGKPTAVQVKLDPRVEVVGSVGQIFGSAIGRAVAGDNQFAQLAAGTVGGLIGQKLGQLVATSLLTDVSSVQMDAIFGNVGVNIAGAAAGSVASFLTAELGTALGLSGYGAQLFNAAVGGYAGSVLNQAINYSFGLTTEAISWSSAFNNAGLSVGTAIGSILANQIVHAENIGGAIGGQLGGAVGGLIGAAVTTGLTAVLGVIVPGIGAFMGTVLGTILGNVIGAEDYPTSLHYVHQGENSYDSSFHSSDDGGDPSVSAAMGSAAIGMVNAYLSAVESVAIGPGTASSLIGYTLISNGTSALYRASVDGGQSFHEGASADEVTRWLAVQLLQGTEAVGGNLLLKRAHHNGNAPDMLTLAGDLQVAQDYERYLDNREVINALIAANPNTAFTAGWAATFARVQDLGLSHYGAVDFLGGMVTGYLDSVRKAGLNFSLADVSVKHGSDGSVTIAIHVPGNVDIPGALSVFANHTDVVNDATGKTVQFVFTDGLAAGRFHGPASSTIVNGIQMVTASGGNSIWFGRDDMSNNFNGASASDAIIVGGALNDALSGSGGADFMDGGAGNDDLYGGTGNDVLRGGSGADAMSGSQGNDTYVFSRNDGVDSVWDIYQYTTLVPGGGPGGTAYYQTVHANGGLDTLAFGSDIKSSDMAFQLSGNDLIIGIKDPANQGQSISQMANRITLHNWLDPLDRIEKFVFADGTTLDFSSLVGLPAGFATIDTAGSTSLMQIGTNYYFYANGIGPMLKYGGVPFTSTMLEGRTLLGVEATSFGYQLAMRMPGADEYTVWNTDSSGNVIGNGTGGVVHGNSPELISLEPSFHQDLNGDGAIGIPPIETAGSTVLMLSNNNYYLNSKTTGTGPVLKYQGSPVLAANWGAWSVIAAEQVSGGGYNVVWKSATSVPHYSVWSTDSEGNFLNTLAAAPEVLGNDASLEALEPVLHQDLNGDGTIGVPTTIETLGSTSLVLSANNYYLIGLNTGTGPTLKYQGSPVLAANYGTYKVIAAEQLSDGGYNVVWKNSSTGLFSIWNTDSNGNFIKTVAAAPELGGTGMSLKALEPMFQQDLNGDGAIGLPSIELNGSTITVLDSGYYFMLSASTGTGQSLKYQGSPVIAANYGAYAVIAAEQVSGGGYNVAWKNSSTGKFSIWSTDSSGNFLTTLAAAPEVNGTDPSLKALEATFHQDLNGDGVIGASPVVLDLDGNGVNLVSLSNSSASFDMDGQGAREHTAWISGGDGLLAIDVGANGSAGPDGVINQAKEIVFTAWAPGTTSDMAALAQVFDTNHNSQLDSGDRSWSDFRIWQDANGDGISQAGEVKSLDVIGISSIGLDPKGEVQSFADGSAISGLANFSWKDGTVGEAADVSLAYEAEGSASHPLVQMAADGLHGPLAPIAGGGEGFAFALNSAAPIDVDHLASHVMSQLGWHMA
ncbi:calcium-binding protein [Bradyrhizobium tunisiense]|uniref:calcium-binding protein n=1 Tax=Bradyrhizobium tunisiense TaxID=3278709 RepID=UPI0035D6A412